MSLVILRTGVLMDRRVDFAALPSRSLTCLLFAFADLRELLGPGEGVLSRSMGNGDFVADFAVGFLGADLRLLAVGADEDVSSSASAHIPTLRIMLSMSTSSGSSRLLRTDWLFSSDTKRRSGLGLSALGGMGRLRFSGESCRLDRSSSSSFELVPGTVAPLTILNCGGSSIGSSVAAWSGSIGLPPASDDVFGVGPFAAFPASSPEDS